ncbi:glycine betaine/L-proline ABC transporter substrate-binding protein ProX [Mesorhizobium calcicola]|uniref:Glycine betaine/L-proline ABC transporter substrate-binding protein ProX n=1 Tax=Mesorhizobium calcicola TaxID=1300310 RepID=A0ABW4WFD8_9HYPH
MKFKIAVATIAIVASATLSAGAEQVKYGWLGGVNEELFQGYVVRDGLRELGYDVEEQPEQVQVPLAHTAVAAGDLQYYPAHWAPMHKAFWEGAGGDEKLMTVGTLVHGDIQGYLIDKKTADATGIKYLEDLKDPEKAKLFDIDGNGKADLFGCDPGWGCERMIEHHLDAYGLRATVEHKQGSYFAIMADAIERIKEGKPTLYYTWVPGWISGVLVPGKDVTWLNVKSTSLPDGQTGSTEIEGLGNLGFPVNDTKVIANTAWLKANPSAKNFLEEVTIPVDDVSAENKMIYDGEKSPDQIAKHATDWIAAHKTQWNKWIADAKAAK